MNITINPQAPLPIYAQLMDQIKDHIYNGHLAPEAQLPSVRQMAEKLEVNSLTIQKAYKGLEAEGLINIKKGVGAFVAANIDLPKPSDMKSQLEKELQQLVNNAKQQELSEPELVQLVRDTWKNA